MKKIVKGNDFTLRIPVMKMVEGEKAPFPLPSCTDVVVRVTNSFKRIDLEFYIDVAEDNVILARVEGDKLSLGTYAIEVKGKIFGNDWRSNEYPQFQIVSKNADADTEFGSTDEGDNSVEMDTALVILPPTVELSNLISDTNAALKEVKATDKTLTDNEAARVEAEKQRVAAEAERVKAEEARMQAEEKRASDTSAALSKIKADTDTAISNLQQSSSAIMSELDEHKNAFDEAEATRVTNEQARVQAENNRVESEDARALAESKRAKAESNRQTESERAVKAADDAAVQANATNDSIKTDEVNRVEAESARVKAEKSRADEEGIRQESETERIRKETERQANERGRVDAESKRVEAEKQREATLKANEEQRNATLAKTKADCETAAKAANDAAADATLAKTKAETATADAEKVNASLEGNVLTVTNRNGEKKSVNLTDSDEHVTVNCTTTLEGVSMEGLVINVYVNNGADSQQYTTDVNGQAEFTITKGATYKVVFPYVQKCNIIDPVQHVASVGNRIIDANYIAETEKVERVTIKMSKADESGNVTPWEGGKAYVTISGKKTEYAMDAEGKAIVEIKNGTSYTVSVDKIDGMYEQYDRYSITRTAIADSYRFSFIYRPYESGIWLIDDENKQWTYDDWEASGNDNSKLMFVRIATLATQRYQGDILISIDKMADFSKVSVSKQWCNQNVQFKNIPLNGRDTSNSNWSRFAYNGLLATQTIIAEGDERELTTAAADYCYGFTIQNGDKTYQGYLPTAYQWELTWQNMDIVIDAIGKKYPDLNVSRTTFSGNKWTSTQRNAGSSFCFSTAASYGSESSSFLAFPFFACLSTSPSLLSLPDEQGASESASKQESA